MVCRGVRGATTIDHDDRESILKATRELLALMIRLNGIEAEDVASAYFTTSPDVTAAYPAVAARQLGWLDVPLICGHEMNVPDGLPRCIRALVHWNTIKGQKEIQHIYLREAERLRPDKKMIIPEIDMNELENWIQRQLAVWEQ